MTSIRLIDSHTHIDSRQFEADRAEVIARSEAAGVDEWIIPATTVASTRLMLVAPWRTSRVHVAAGIHPHHVKDHEMTAMADLESILLSFPEIVAIGETGIDYFYDDGFAEKQMKFFEAHLDLAEKFHKPLIVHARDARDPKSLHPSAYRDILDSTVGSKIKGVLHSFTGTTEIAREAIEAGWYIGLNGILTFKQSDALRETAREVPLERVLLETDAPYLAPIPHRGKRNEPSYLLRTLDVLSTIRGVSASELAVLINQNTRRLFSLT